MLTAQIFDDLPGIEGELKGARSHLDALRGVQSGALGSFRGIRERQAAKAEVLLAKLEKTGRLMRSDGGKNFRHFRRAAEIVRQNVRCARGCHRCSLASRNRPCAATRPGGQSDRVFVFWRS